MAINLASKLKGVFANRVTSALIALVIFLLVGLSSYWYGGHTARKECKRVKASKVVKAVNIRTEQSHKAMTADKEAQVKIAQLKSDLEKLEAKENDCLDQVIPDSVIDLINR